MIGDKNSQDHRGRTETPTAGDCACLSPTLETYGPLSSHSSCRVIPRAEHDAAYGVTLNPANKYR